MMKLLRESLLARHASPLGSVLDSTIQLHHSVAFHPSRAITSNTAYDTHVPLTRLQKGVLTILASLGAFANPRRADLVAIVGETTGITALKLIRDRMYRSEEGRRVLAEMPRVRDASLQLYGIKSLPPSTFGGAYATFMEKRRFQADERPAVRFIDDAELAYIATRAREVHDFWHVLFDCETNVFGEVALKAVEFAQTGLPMTAMAVLAGEWRLKEVDRKELNKIYLPWAATAGSQAADLMTLYYEEYFDRDLNELRKLWHIQPAPKREGSVQS